MTEIDAAISRIRAAIDQSRVPPARLARAAGLSVNALRGVRREQWDPRASTLNRVLVWLDANRAEQAGGAHGG